MQHTSRGWALAAGLAFAFGVAWLCWLDGGPDPAGAQAVTYAGPPFSRVRTIADNTATPIIAVAVPNGDSCGLVLAYTAQASDGTVTQTHSGVVAFAAVANNVGAVTANANEETELVVDNGGTYSDIWAATTGANTASLTASFNSSLDLPSTIRFSILHPLKCVTTFP